MTGLRGCAMQNLPAPCSPLSARIHETQTRSKSTYDSNNNTSSGLTFSEDIQVLWGTHSGNAFILPPQGYKPDIPSLYKRPSVCLCVHTRVLHLCENDCCDGLALCSSGGCAARKTRRLAKWHVCVTATVPYVYKTFSPHSVASIPHHHCCLSILLKTSEKDVNGSFLY